MTDVNILKAWWQFECSDYRVSKPYHSLDFYEASPKQGGEGEGKGMRGEGKAGKHEQGEEDMRKGSVQGWALTNYW